MSATPTTKATERCKRSPVPGGCHCWLRSTAPAGPARCYWCAAEADPILELGDPPAAIRRRRADAPDASGDLFEAPA